MLPESMAPPLPHYEEFKAFMEERGIVVRRLYMPETPRQHGAEIREYGNEGVGFEGEFHPAYWQVTICREERRGDGRVHAYYMVVPDEIVQRGWTDVWAHEAKLVDLGWKHYLEKAEKGQAT